MASQNDFEEFGVDQSTLTEMRQVCGNISCAASQINSFFAPLTISTFHISIIFKFGFRKGAVGDKMRMLAVWCSYDSLGAKWW